MYNKAQASIEFLMTYGWALIVIVIIVGVLVFLINPANISQNNCDVKLGELMIQQSSVSASSLELVITNNSSQSISNLDFSISGSATGTLTDQSLDIGDTQLFTIPVGLLAGNYILDVNVSYDTPLINSKTGKAQCRGSI